MAKRYKVIVNDIESFQSLVQSIYDETDAIINQAQSQIDRLENSTDLQDELMDGKQKYSSAVHNFIGDKDKAIGRRIEIAKLLADLIKNQGNVKKTLENQENEKEVTNLSLDELKRTLREQAALKNQTQLY